MIELQDVSFKTRKKTIINQQSCAMPVGELIVLIGPNGAGKSTMLGLMSGRLKPSSGEVLLDGCPLDSWPLLELARCRAVMSQRVQLSFGFSAKEVIELGRSAFVDDDFKSGIIDEVIQLCGLACLARQDFLSLSGGQQQRVHFARALAQIWDAPRGHACLLLDEPDAGLDIAHQDLILRIAKDYAHQGQTVVVVLHNLHLAARYADRIMLVADGAVVKQGSAMEVLKPNHLSAVYGINLCQVGSENEPILVPAS